eukprot:s464_g1.t1
MLARSFFLHIVPLAWLLSVRPAHDSDSHAKDDDDDKDKATTKSSNTSNTSWQKVNQTIRDLVNNVLVADINQTHQLPDPEGNYSDPQNRSGLGKLAQTLEFLYLKDRV